MSFTAPIMTLQPPVSLRDRVYEHVKGLILTGEIASSDIITELSLSKQMGISRTPVREALHYLEKEGLLVSLPKKGYRVRELCRQELEEICEIRCALETLSAKWAINRITEEQLDRFEENIIRAERKLSKGDLLAFIALDGEFHELVAQASGNKQLSGIIESLRNDMTRSRSMGLHEKGIQRALEGHRSILKCLIDKDIDRVEAVIRDHLEDLKHDSIKLDASPQLSSKRSVGLR